MTAVYLVAIVLPLLVLAANLGRGAASSRSSRRRGPSLRARTAAALRPREPRPHRRPSAPSRRGLRLVEAPPPAPSRPSLARRIAAVPRAFVAGTRAAWAELTGDRPPAAAPAASRPAAPAIPHARTPSSPGWVPAPGYAAQPTPLVAVPADRPPAAAAPERAVARTCPDCAEPVASRAVACRHCGYQFAFGAQRSR